jgi:hypothetical protein
MTKAAALGVRFYALAGQVSRLPRFSGVYENDCVAFADDVGELRG